MILVMSSLVVLTLSLAAARFPPGQQKIPVIDFHAAAAQAAGTKTPTPSLTSTSTPTPVTCPPDSPLSVTYLPDSTFIDLILPLPDGSYLLRGRIDDHEGTWLAKMDSTGKLLWQNLYGSRTADVQLAANGNILLSFSRSNIEIGVDGKVVRAVDMPWYLPSADGSFTVIQGPKVSRYRDMQTPLWQVEVKNFGGLAATTSDGGALFAYAGGYTDTSVYYAPQYTDIKVIKILSDGQALQRVYGKLVGDETLDYLKATGDGGALLAGTHFYDQLGSDYDIWLMKLNAGGGMGWQTTLKLAPYGEFLNDIFFLKTGYLVMLTPADRNDPVLVRLTPGGSLTWQKVISSSRGEVKINAAADTPDGGLLLAGSTWEKTEVYWLAKLDGAGRLIWEKTTGFDLPGEPDNEVLAILPLADKQILLGGLTNQVGEQRAGLYSAWAAQIPDAGQPLGLVTLTPGRIAAIVTLGGRPNTLKDEIQNGTAAPLREITFTAVETNLRPHPACLLPGAHFPTPAALPSLTPSVTPTLAFTRDLYLTDPPMQGEDVLKIQQRLYELGYTEVGARDGLFGRMTDAAVRNFQTRNNLVVDGYVGPKTLRQLFSANAVRAGGG